MSATIGDGADSWLDPMRLAAGIKCWADAGCLKYWARLAVAATGLAAAALASALVSGECPVANGFWQAMHLHLLPHGFWLLKQSPESQIQKYET